MNKADERIGNGILATIKDRVKCDDLTLAIMITRSNYKLIVAEKDTETISLDYDAYAYSPQEAAAQAAIRIKRLFDR